MRPLLLLYSLFTTFLLLFTSFISHPSPLILTATLAQSTPTPDRQEADRLSDLGNQQLDTNQYQAALQSFQQALKLYREIGDRHNEAWALNGVGLAYEGLEDYQQAIDYYQQALPIFQQIDDQGGEAIALMNLGIAYRFLSDNQQAIDYYQRALPLFKQIGDRITADPTVTGTITDANPIVEFTASIVGSSVGNVNVLGDRNPDGSFTFNRARLEQMYGAPLVGRGSSY